jgi:hypothetical protein
VHNVTTSSNIPSGQFTLSYDSINNIATFTYTGGTFLPDGDYTATLNAAASPIRRAIRCRRTSCPASSSSQGDANHDRAVNLLDFNILASNFGQSPRDFTQATSPTTAQWTCWTSTSWPESSARRSVRSRSSPRPLAECRGCRARSRAARLAERSPPAASRPAAALAPRRRWAAARTLAAPRSRLVARIDRRLAADPDCSVGGHVHDHLNVADIEFLLDASARVERQPDTDDQHVGHDAARCNDEDAPALRRPANRWRDRLTVRRT